LLLSVSRQNSSNTHRFMARLVDNAGNAVAGRILTLELNDTQHEYNQTTDQNGNATWTLPLSPQVNDSATTYNIAVSFAGDPNPKTATAYLYTPNDTRYAVCTTTQYASYKPSTNSTSILVWPQTTRGETTLKSPDQLQAEAKSSGWLSVYNEFTWWYPWYRLHIKVQVGDPTTIDVGFNPFLAGTETFSWDGLNVFTSTIEGVWESIMFDVLGMLGAYALAKVFSFTTAWIIIEALKNIAQMGLLWWAWSNRDLVLAISLASFIMGFIALSVHVAEQFSTTLFNLSWAGSMAYMYKSMGEMVTEVQGVSSYRTWVDWVEILSDFGLGAFALAHYFGVI